MPDVICPGCKSRYHETTDRYDADKVPNGSMLRLKEPWRSWGWSSFPELDSSVLADLECPGCGVSYLNKDNRLTVDVPADIDAHIKLMSAEGLRPSEIGERVGLTHQAVTKRIKAMDSQGKDA